MRVETGRTFDILETCCFPEGCLIPEDRQLCLATVHIPQLKAAGMTTGEWTRGALMLEEPHLTKVRGIVCRQCNIRKCSFNPRFRPSDGLSHLTDGDYPWRVKEANRILAQLLPPEEQAELERQGIRWLVGHHPSKKHPMLWLSFKRGGEERNVTCHIGERRLLTNEGEETLHSIGQLRERIQEAIQALP